MKWLLTALCLATGAQAQAPEPQIYHWADPAPELGGLSGLVVEDGGTHLVAVTDRGTLVEADITRTNGQITAITSRGFFALNGPGKPPLTEFQRDAEALSPALQGGYYIGFESLTRLRHYPAPGGAPKVLHRWDYFKDLFGNQGFEAVATLAGGQVLVIVEGKGRGHSTPAYLYADGQWSGPVAFPISGGFAVTGADLGPDGALYLVERKFSVLSGFATRIRRLFRQDDQLFEEVLFTGKLGNAEGISAWQEGERVVMTLVTDNGFRASSPTQVIELHAAAAGIGPATAVDLPILRDLLQERRD